METIDITEAGNLLKGFNNVAIMFHKNPDGDALGAAQALCLGLRQQGKQCRILNRIDEVPNRFNSFIEKDCFDSDFVYETVIALDLASSELICKYLESVKINLTIDHHLNCSLEADFGLINSNAAATCELIYDILIQLKVEINQKIAQSLYIGIATDTGCFKFQNTTSKTHIVAASLFKAGIDFSKINFDLFDRRTKAQLNLQNLAFQKLRFFLNGRCAMVLVSKSDMQSCNCCEADFFIITDMIRSIEEVEIAIAARQVVGGVKFSVRTVAGLSAARFCEQFGGGGHENAAGFEFKGAEFEQIEAEVLEKMEEFFS